MADISSKLTWFCVITALAVIGIYDCGHFDHNDFQYGVTPLLMQGRMIYRDFSFDQTPLQAWIGFAGLKLLGAQWVFAGQRILSLLALWGAIFIGALICRRRTAARNLATLLFVLGCLAAQPLIVVGGEIGNYAVGLLLFAAALWLFFEHRGWSPLVGLLAGLAVAEKLSALYPAAAFGALYLLEARRWRLVAGYALGALAGVTPVLFYWHAAPAAFWFDNVTYHYLIAAYRGVPFHAARWPLLLGAALVLAVARWLWAEAWRLVALLAAALVALVTPGILFPQYWAPVAFVLVILGCWIVLRHGWARYALAVVMVAAGVQATLMLREAGGQLRWHVYALSEALHLQRAAAWAPVHDCKGELVSAFAALAGGSGMALAPISSEGPFMMRMDAVLRARAPRFRDFSDVTRWLKPDSLIMTGFFPGTPYEDAMNAYARAQNMHAISLGRYMNKPITLYAPGNCAG